MGYFSRVKDNHMWRIFFPVWDIFPWEIYSPRKGFPRVSIYPRRKVSCKIFFHVMKAEKEDSHLIITNYYAYYSCNKSPCSSLVSQSWISNAYPVHGHIFRTCHEYLTYVYSFPFPWWRNRYLLKGMKTVGCDFPTYGNRIPHMGK